MPTPLPDAVNVMRAIDLYMNTAYPADAPAVVHSRVEALRQCGGELLSCREFVAEPRDGGPRYLLRLGNPFYPHMKLAIEPSPAGDRYLYRADTHDRHICPKPESPEFAAFTQLMENNRRLSELIESAWEQAGLSTFKSYLREDLERRRAAMASVTPPKPRT